jgi:hypothetical protein
MNDRTVVQGKNTLTSIRMAPFEALRRESIGSTKWYESIDEMQKHLEV